MHKNVWLNNNNNYWYTNTNNFQTLVNLSASLSLHLTIRLKVFISEGITLKTISWKTMQKTLLTALQCISEIIQFNREHKQVQNEKSLCTRKDVCAVYTFVCTVCVAVEKHIREYINLTFYFFCWNKWMDGCMDSWVTWYLVFVSKKSTSWSTCEFPVNQKQNFHKIINKRLTKN